MKRMNSLRCMEECVSVKLFIYGSEVKLTVVYSECDSGVYQSLRDDVKKSVSGITGAKFLENEERNKFSVIFQQNDEIWKKLDSWGWIEKYSSRSCYIPRRLKTSCSLSSSGEISELTSYLLKCSEEYMDS